VGCKLTQEGGNYFGIRQQLFDTLFTASPELFDSASVALSQVGLAVLERISSLLLHFSWGLLCVFAVAFKKKRFLYLALPMGLVDFLVLYAGSMDILTFELLLFGLSLICLLATLNATKTERKNATVTYLHVREEEDKSLKALVRTNFKRAISFGMLYLILGIALSVLTGGIISGSASSAASASADVPVLVTQTFPIMLPMCVVIGSLGGLMVFVSDRTRGVYEYLIAYGISVYEIFWSTLLVTLGLVTVVLGVSLAGNIAITLLIGGSIQPAMINMLLIYTLPISYASAAFMTMAGMIWSSLTVRVPGVNSPVGISTLLGIGPTLAVLVLSIFFTGSSNFLLLVGGVTLILTMLVIGMMVVANKKMNRERLLADA
jgi:hypothetical protein